MSAVAVSIPTIEVIRKTRGANSREIKYTAVGKWKDVTYERESKPVIDKDGNPVLDEKGNEKREPLGKDKDGKLITMKETVQEPDYEGVLTSIEQAMYLTDNDEQLLLDCFVEGWNERQYSMEAGKDELDSLISDLAMTEEERAVFKRTVRSLSKNTETDLLDAGELVKAMFVKGKAKAAAKAAASA